MLLQEFIDLKTEELKQSNLYREVIFHRAEDVQIKKFCVSEDYIAKFSKMDYIVEEVQSNQSNLSDIEQAGAKVMFDVLKKKKRNHTTETFYVIYK